MKKQPQADDDDDDDDEDGSEDDDDYGKKNRRELIAYSQGVTLPLRVMSCFAVHWHLA